MGALIFLYLAIIVLLIVSIWNIFIKAGKPGWTSLIPVYNIIVFIEITGKPIWWIFLFVIPIINIIFIIWTLNLFAISFGKNTGFTIGILFLPFIFYPILAFGDAKYNGPAGKQAK